MVVIADIIPPDIYSMLFPFGVILQELQPHLLQMEQC